MLRVSGISVRFGEHQAVHDVDLSVPTGTIVGLIGPIGAGKTTTFKAICGVQPCEGTVTISDVDTSDLPPQASPCSVWAGPSSASRSSARRPGGQCARRRRAALSSHARSRRWTNGEVDRILSLLGLENVASRRADELPAGQARLVELGRALAAAPQILLLDEPTSDLDEQETARLERVLRAVADDGIGTLLVEHDIELVSGDLRADQRPRLRTADRHGLAGSDSARSSGPRRLLRAAT